MDLLQIFLFLNVFVIGALTAIGIRHAYAHFRPDAHEKHASHPAPVKLPPAVRQELLDTAAKQFEKILERSASELQKDMQATGSQLNTLLEKLGTNMVEQELKRYRDSLEDLRTQTETTLHNAQADITTHQAELDTQFEVRKAELEAKLTEEMAAEKQRLLSQIDTKLADAVASFLLETMQHNVDLGAQTPYLTKLLEEHKADFAREVGDAPTASK
jgi:F0F1-type ATP synthase membrane subunit b/b'